ncbi:hypothetical protein B7Z00_00285 [Candidatus Saccharibacteria bacterium 32-50-10]|nr:MAG: hypothetical protein B7Z00_00285 [Candidatus Saccharibacteria bacterium 32-50-10]
MVEKINANSPEQARKFESLEKAGAERSAELQEQLNDNRESGPEADQEQLSEARHEALELAQPVEKELSKSPEKTKERPRHNRPTKKDLDANFQRSMDHIRKDMSPTSRAFSKIIHNPAVDKISEAVASTVARPNLILAGGLGTLILCTAVYLLAKRYGYVLSGFEAIGTFLLGWAIGAVIEFARVGFSNQRNR